MSNSTASRVSTVGVDAGASLCKVAMAGERALRTAVFAAKDLDAVVDCIREWKAERVFATGGGAARLNGRAGVPVQTVPEFEAWAHGAPILARSTGLDLPESYLLVSLGTGTSVLGLHEGRPQRVRGTALGGGTLLGLGKLLLEIKSFAELTALARRGDRSAVDLLVGDIYEGLETPLPRSINAASFGKLDSTRPEDLAAALMGLVGENIALICGALARAQQASSVVYCGSTLRDNPVLQQILTQVTLMLGVPSHFLDDGAFCGAVGAAALGGGFDGAQD